MSGISVDSQIMESNQEGFFPVEEGRRFPEEPHNTSLSFFLDFKRSDLWGIQGKVRDQECSKGRFRRWPWSPVLLHACFDDREGWMCFIVMRYRGWVVNSLEQGSRVARELDIAGAHHPEGHLEKSPALPSFLLTFL